MGWKYEVSTWTNIDGNYKYVTVYGGKSLIKAISVMIKYRKKTGCLKLEIR